MKPLVVIYANFGKVKNNPSVASSLETKTLLWLCRKSEKTCLYSMKNNFLVECRRLGNNGSGTDVGRSPPRLPALKGS